MKAEPPPGYARPADLFHVVNVYRRSQSVPQLSNVQCLISFVCHHREKIRKIRIRSNFVYYHINDTLDAFADSIYNQYIHVCSKSQESIRNSHLIATEKILNDPNYQPRHVVLKEVKCPPYRLHKFVFYKVIIPYYDLERKRLLYPVDQVKYRAACHLLWNIRKKLGNEFADHVKATRPKILWTTMNGIQTIYYCPELSHL